MPQVDRVDRWNEIGMSCARGSIEERFLRSARRPFVRKTNGKKKSACSGRNDGGSKGMGKQARAQLQTQTAN
jgi:hypothetical protein